MATLTPSEKHWQVAPTLCLPSPSILTRFATESIAGCQAPRNRQLPFDRLMSPWGQNRKSSMRAYDFRFAPESGHCATESACPFRAKRRHPLVSRSVELEHLFQESFDALFGFPGGDRILAGVRAVNDAGVRVGE